MRAGIRAGIRTGYGCARAIVRMRAGVVTRAIRAIRVGRKLLCRAAHAFIIAHTTDTPAPGKGGVERSWMWPLVEGRESDVAAMS